MKYNIDGDGVVCVLVLRLSLEGQLIELVVWLGSALVLTIQEATDEGR